MKFLDLLSASSYITFLGLRTTLLFLNAFVNVNYGDVRILLLVGMFSSSMLNPSSDSFKFYF